MKVSVALAAYNGEKYIAEQIKSILPQLGEEDELIVSDDGSTDSTREVVASLSDERIRLITNNGARGVVSNFHNAIAATTGDIIILSDQDDVWEYNKVEVLRQMLTCESPKLAVHGARATDDELNELADGVIPLKRGYLANLMSNSYTGAMMAFNRALKELILPLPSGIAMHDWFIALVCERARYSIAVTDKVLMSYRRHAQTVTGGKRQRLIAMLGQRIRMHRAVSKRLRAIRRKRSN